MPFRYFAATDNQSTNTGTELYSTDLTSGNTGRVADINAGPGSSNPADFVTIGTNTYFTADDGVHGRELYLLNGITNTVTRLDRLPASGSADYKSIVAGSIIALTTTKVIFAATDNQSTNTGTELYVTDGTAAGTQRLVDLNPGSASSNPSDFTDIAGFGALFLADDGTHGRELYFFNGAAVTRLDKLPASGTADYKQPDPATVVFTGPTALFAATDNQTTNTGTELYLTTGTAAGTARVGDINPGPGSSNPANILLALGKTFFTADDGTHGQELYAQTGVAAPVRLDRLPASGTADYKTIVPSSITVVGNRVIYVATDNQTTNTGIELYSTDGTAAGTARVGDISPGAGNSSPGNFVVGKNSAGQDVAYFTADDGNHGVQVYVYNSATNVTTRLDNLPASGPAAYKTVVPGSITLAGTGATSRVVFTATDNTATNSGAELYSSDGTAAGTGKVADINPGAGSSNPTNFIRTAVNNLLFEADNGTLGNGLYIYRPASDAIERLDSAPGGNAAYKNLTSGTVTVLGPSQFVFAATDNTATNSGTELYFTDGFAAGTVKVADISPGAGSSNPSGFQVISDGGVNKAVFTADDGVHGRELYVFNPATNATTRLDKLPASGTADYKALVFPAGTIYSIAPVDAAKLGTTAGNLAYTFKVSRTGDATTAFTLRYAVTGIAAGSSTAAATASNFTGNVLPNGTVTLQAGQTEAYVTVNVAGSPALAQQAGFSVTLSLPSGISAGTSNSAIAAPSAAGTIQGPTPTPTPGTVPAYVSANLPGASYSAAANTAATAALTALPNSGTVTTATSPAGPFAAAVAGTLNVAVATAPVAGTAIALPAGYGALQAQGAGAATLSDGGAANAVLIGAAGATTFNSTGTGVTLIGGNAANRFNVSGSATVATGDGASTVVASGSGAANVTTGTGGSTIVLAGGASTVQANGQDTVFGGAGTVSITAAKGAVAVGGAGLMTFIGGTATSVVFGGKGGLNFTGGSAFEVAVGTTGVMKAKAGSGGGEFFGYAGGDQMQSGAAQTIMVLGAGGKAVSTGAGGNFLVGGTGTAVLDGSAATGNDVFFGGTGNTSILCGSGTDLIGTGTGTSTVQLGAGTTTVFAFGTSTVTAGSGSGTVVMGGTVALNIAQAGAGAARNFALFNFVPGTDRINLSGYGAGTVADAVANQVNGNGQTVMTLSDKTQLQLIGVARADAGFFS